MHDSFIYLLLLSQNGSCVKTPIPCDVDFTKKEMHKLTFDSLEEDHSYNAIPRTAHKYCRLSLLYVVYHIGNITQYTHSLAGEHTLHVAKYPHIVQVWWY